MTDRKKDHIKLALQSRVEEFSKDHRFSYEPMLHPHPSEKSGPFSFLGKTMHAPIWISSMTGGTQLAGKINHNLARACKEFGLGMGLGSCRILFDDDTYLEQFALRPVIGPEAPFFANLGIAQVESLITGNRHHLIRELIQKLDADGLIIHVNPLQEWLQPEGDRLKLAPVETIKRLLDKLDINLIVKEVGQGFGPESLYQLLQLPLAAIDFGALGGTNFAIVELLRGEESKMDALEPLSKVGHTAEEMLEMINRLVGRTDNLQCREIIISGGITSFLDGYYLMAKSKLPAIYGQGSAMLKFAREEYEFLQDFIRQQLNGLQIAGTYLNLTK